MYRSLLAATCMAFMLVSCGGAKGKKVSSASALSHDSVEYFEKHVGDRVLFDFNKSHLTDAAKVQLDKQAEWLKAHQHHHVKVEGHCDKVGTREYNLGLGERRAHAAKKHLLAKGFKHEHISTISYGKEKPASLDNDALNRRAVTVLGKGK